MNSHNPSAFPVQSFEDHWGTQHAAEGGMTLRDYFAAKAMQGILSDNTIDPEADRLAKTAYKIADAMLKARQT